MGLFRKLIGPVFLKTNNQTIEYINRLKGLYGKSTGDLREEIEKQVTIAEYGLKGEESIAFELKNSGKDMYILQDIYLEAGDLSAQIDYLVVTRKRIYILECKNLIGDIEVNNTGDFIRTYQIRGKKIREGIYSPITQNIRHMHVIKEVRKASRSNNITKKIFESHFDDNYKSIVVLANPKTILNAKYAKKEIKEQIVRADQLVSKIREMDQQVEHEMSAKEMLEVANYFLERNRPDRLDYAEKYEKMLEQVKTAKENVMSAAVENKEKLIKDLKAFRLERSRREKIKPYYIFNDVQMEELIEKNPKNKIELCKVSGFGDIKAEKYGDDILEILSLYTREVDKD